MIRTENLAVSRPHYAFKRDTWRPQSFGIGATAMCVTSWTVDAAWFKRRNGVLTATMGRYHPMVTPHADRPTDGTYSSWITAANDNRYGGDWLAFWDGKAIVNFDRPTPDETAARIAFLDAMLRGYPDPPAGYEGWWTFPKVASR